MFLYYPNRDIFLKISEIKVRVPPGEPLNKLERRFEIIKNAWFPIWNQAFFMSFKLKDLERMFKTCHL